MKIVLLRLISRVLMVTLAALPFTAQAGLIATDEAVAPAMQTERAKVRDFLARADVQQQLQTHGLTAQAAQERVDALTDAEVQQIAGQVDTVPAGAASGAVAVVGLAVLLVLVTYVIVRAFYPQR